MVKQLLTKRQALHKKSHPSNLGDSHLNLFKNPSKIQILSQQNQSYYCRRNSTVLQIAFIGVSLTSINNYASKKKPVPI